MRVIPRLFFAALLVASGLVGGAAFAASDTLVVAKNLEDVLSLDPAEAYENTTGEILNNAYARIVRRGADGAIVGDVAERWSVSEDGRTFTFVLGKGQAFPSGRPVTASDAAYSLRRVVLLDKTPSFLLRIFGWDRQNVDAQVRAEGDDRLVLRIGDALAPDLVLRVLSTSVGAVLDEALLRRNERNGDLGNGWLRTAWAGGGPFRIAAWNAKEAIVLEANPAYPRGKPPLRRVIFRHVAESASQALLLGRGDVDAAYNLQPDQIKALAPGGDIAVVSTPKLTQIYVPMNLSDPALAKPKVREALRWLIDYDGIARHLLDGQWVVHQSFYGLGIPGALTDNPYRLDVDRAKALLAEAGYPDGLALDLDVETGGPYPDIAQSFQETFARAGVRLNLLQSDRRQVLTKYRARNYAMILWHASSDYDDPNAAASDYAFNEDRGDASAVRNRAWRSNWVDPRANALTEAGLHERDPSRRAGIYDELQRRMRAEAPFLFAFQQVEQIALRRNVVGLVNGPTYDAALYVHVRKD